MPAVVRGNHGGRKARPTVKYTRTADRPSFSFANGAWRDPVGSPLMTADELQNLIEEATADYALGENEPALKKLSQAVSAAPESFEAWHALAEVNFSLRLLDAALSAAERAHALRPSDLFINTTLSRIWMERGDKARAEHFGAQAKIQSWKDQLKNPSDSM
jgi:predicted Zn-dependent protease